MATFFTSDLHLGHRNIIEYCARPFKDVDHMNHEIIARWNMAVAPEDTVYILGDLAMGELDKSLGLVALLQGQKFLVPGNHDRVWSGYYSKGVRDSDVERYSAAGLTIMPEQLRYTSFKQRDLPASWTLCHFPDLGDSQESGERYAEHRPPAPMPGSILVHGHVHTAWKFNGPRVNVGVDMWDFRPVSELEIYGFWQHGHAKPEWFIDD